MLDVCQSREKKRAEERLTLKHKNTSKWVKHMLGRAYGDDADEETREAIQEQVLSLFALLLRQFTCFTLEQEEEITLGERLWQRRWSSSSIAAPRKASKASKLP
jgi:hypothetical protein